MYAMSADAHAGSLLVAHGGTNACTFDVIDAGKAQETAREFFHNKFECYRRFGSEAAVNYGTMVPAGLRLIVARDANGTQVGGVAIYERSATRMLPLEVAIGHEPCVAEEIRTWQDERLVVEFSGLWIAERWRRTGLSRTLLLIAMSVSHHVKATKVVGFSHHHVVDFYRTTGLVPHPSASRFHYPHAPYISMLVWGDPVAFSTLPLSAMSEVRGYVSAIGNRLSLGWTA